MSSASFGRSSLRDALGERYPGELYDEPGPAVTARCQICDVRVV
jgi:hypothetical protein